MTDDKPHYARDGKCTTCKSPAPCHIIAQQAATEWREMADVWDSLHAYLEPGRGAKTSGGSRPAPASKPPISLVASDLIQEIADWAWFYASALMDETHDYVPPADTPGRLRDIAKRYGHFTTGDDQRWVSDPKATDDMPPGHWQRVALDYCDQAHELRRKVVGLIVQPPPPRFMGPCTVTDCGGDVYLKAGEKVARCVECDQGHDDAELRIRLWRALDAHLLRRDELRGALNMLREPGTKRVSPERIRQWIKRGRLVPVFRDPEMFRLTDAMELAGFEVAA